MTEAVTPLTIELERQSIPSADPGDPPPTAGTYWATRASFFIAGFGVAAWAPLIPLVKNRLHLDDGQLGGLLLCLGTGSVIGMPIAGALAGRFGVRRMIAVTALLLIAMLPLLATVNHLPLMVGTLLLFGAGLGSLDVVMNVHAAIVEKRSGRAMMSGFHGMYSVGGMAGAGLMSLLLASTGPVAGVVTVVVILLILLASSYRFLLPGGGDAGASSFALPHGRVLLIGSFCFVLFLAEGAVLDWSAVLLKDLRGLTPAQAGLGYAAFSLTMTVCRLAGDAIVASVGPARVVLLGALIAAAGFVIAAAFPSGAAGILGFALVGLGASNVVPVMFSAAARQTRMPAGLAIAAVTTLGYAGILLGPASVGFVARATSLPISLMMVAALLAVVAVVSVPARVQD